MMRSIFHNIARSFGVALLVILTIPAKQIALAIPNDPIPNFIRQEAIKYGVDPLTALFIVQHESQFRPEAMGDDGQSRGLWQISKRWHPEVSDEMAFSPRKSTEWALKRIKAGYANEWSTYRFCMKLYQTCPPKP